MAQREVELDPGEIDLEKLDTPMTLYSLAGGPERIRLHKLLDKLLDELKKGVVQ